MIKQRLAIFAVSLVLTSLTVAHTASLAPSAVPAIAPAHGSFA